MPSEDFAAVDAALGGLSIDEKVGALMNYLVVAQCRPETLASLLSLASAMAAMASVLDLSGRVTIAEALRDAADFIEHQRALA